MKEKIKNITILEKTVRRKKDKILKQVQNDMVVQGDRHAFTLAEVLITLGIIGIVAAMTMPTLIQSYKRKSYSTKLKKFYSTMQQAIQLSEVENGSTKEWTFPASNTKEDWDIFYNQYFAKYLKSVEVSIPFNSTYPLLIKFPDGCMKCRNGGVLIDCDYNLVGDTSFKKPNTKTFSYLMGSGGFHPNTWREYSSYYKVPEGEAPINTDLSKRENVLRGCRLVGAWCTYLLYLDGWEFKDDYPHKL